MMDRDFANTEHAPIRHGEAQPKQSRYARSHGLDCLRGMLHNERPTP